MRMEKGTLFKYSVAGMGMMTTMMMLLYRWIRVFWGNGVSSSLNRLLLFEKFSVFSSSHSFCY